MQLMRYFVFMGIIVPTVLHASSLQEKIADGITAVISKSKPYVSIDPELSQQTCDIFEALQVHEEKGYEIKYETIGQDNALHWQEYFCQLGNTKEFAHQAAICTDSFLKDIHTAISQQAMVATVSSYDFKNYVWHTDDPVSKSMLYQLTFTLKGPGTQYLLLSDEQKQACLQYDRAISIKTEYQDYMNKKRGVDQSTQSLMRSCVVERMHDFIQNNHLDEKVEKTAPRMINIFLGDAPETKLQIEADVKDVGTFHSHPVLSQEEKNRGRIIVVISAGTQEEMSRFRTGIRKRKNS